MSLRSIAQSLCPPGSFSLPASSASPFSFVSDGLHSVRSRVLDSTHNAPPLFGYRLQVPMFSTKVSNGRPNPGLSTLSSSPTRICIPVAVLPTYEFGLSSRPLTQPLSVDRRTRPPVPLPAPPPWCSGEPKGEPGPSFRRRRSRSHSPFTGTCLKGRFSTGGGGRWSPGWAWVERGRRASPCRGGDIRSLPRPRPRPWVLPRRDDEVLTKEPY